MRVKFWGTRGSVAAPGPSTVVFGGNTTCLELTLDSGRRIVIDAGTGIRELGDALCATGDPVDLDLLVTHIHWDHVLGFPFFAPIYDPSTRIRVDGFPACMKGLRCTFDNQMGDGFFPVRFEHLSAQIEHPGQLEAGSAEYDGVRVDTIPLQHPQGGYGFRFQEGDRRLVFLTDNELTINAWEGRQPEHYQEFCRGADILIHDAQYTPEEIPSRRGWGHSDYPAVLDLAIAAEVRRLVLFHHDPGRRDEDLAVIEFLCRDAVRQRGVDLEVEAAREGSELRL